MASDMNGGLRTRLAGAVVVAMALTYMGGCGNEPEDNTPDAGNNGTEDAGTDNPTPDAGTRPADSDIALVRLNTDGSLDNTFGTNGIARLDLGPGVASARDGVWGVERDASNRLVVFGSKKGEGDRNDMDRVVVRVNANGTLDETFGTKGVHTLNMSGLIDQPKHGLVQPDGKIVASGYVSAPTGVGAQSANRVVLLRLNENGTADNTFGSKGVVSSAPFTSADPLRTEWGMAEAYSVGLQSTGKYVTTGYGRTAASGAVDVVAFRYTADGQLDTTWGTSGAFVLDVSGDNDRGRDMCVLADDRVAMVGSGIPSPQNLDAMLVMLTADGAPDTSIGSSGYKLYDFGRPDEAFFASAVSADGQWLAAAGYRAGANLNDDAILLIKPVGTGGGTEFAQAVPMSESANDRFWSVTFDAAGKVYAAGYITENGDNRMAVARFNANGTRDTTFGTNGVATVNVIARGTEEMVRGVIVQSDGKIVLAGTVESL